MVGLCETMQVHWVLQVLGKHLLCLVSTNRAWGNALFHPNALMLSITF